MARQSTISGLLTSGWPARTATARNYSCAHGPRFETRHGKAAQPGPVLRVVTFNIKFGEKVGRAIEALAGSPRLRDADILTLQEMDAAGVERIARALSLNSVYFPSAVHPASGRDFGNAVLAPWPLEDARKVHLPHASRGVGLKRSATAVTALVGGRRIQAYSVHLETPWRLGGRSRREQLGTVLDDASRFSGPVVIAGDLNGPRIGRVAEENGFLWLTRNVRSAAAWMKLDHVFVRGLARSGPTAAGAAGHQGASDHRPVWTELSLVG
jgi:endonuclease/exonuclease/phosphatase family metal-dependent hydrolase